MRELVDDREDFEESSAGLTFTHFTLNATPNHFQYAQAISIIADIIQAMATTSSPFLRLPTELRLQIYKHLPCTTKYATARRDEHGTPVIIFVFSYIERAIVAVSRLIRNEAESVIDSETQKCGPTQLISDCEYFHIVPEDLAYVRNARNRFVPNNMGLAEDKREDFSTNFTGLNLVEQARMDAVMSQMWTRLANLYLRSDERIELGIWIGNDHACDRFVQQLDSAIEDIVGPRWDASDFGMYRPRFGVTIQCSEEVESGDIPSAVQDLKDAHFDVSDELDSEERESRWGVHIFDGLFEARELSSDEPSDESGEESDEEASDEMDVESDEAADEEMDMDT